MATDLTNRMNASRALPIAPPLAALAAACSILASCSTPPTGLWSASPIPPGLVDRLAETNVFAASYSDGHGKRGGGNASWIAPRRYALAAHTVPETVADLRVNFGEDARVVSRNVATIEPGWRDGWVEAELVDTAAEYASRAMKWQPDRTLHLNEPIYAVAHYNIANDSLLRANPLAVPESVILPIKICGQSHGLFVKTTLPRGYDLRGMSGAPCLVWDQEAQTLFAVGIFLGIGRDGHGVLVRALPMSRLDDPALALAPPDPSDLAAVIEIMSSPASSPTKH